MRRLTVLRHAKSSWDAPGLDDFDRPLNDRGWKSARRMGRELKARGLRFDYVLASSAVRVRETLEGLSEEYDLSAPIRFEQAIYLAATQTLVSLVRDLPEEVQAPLFVGHNPGLERLLVELTHDDDEGLRDRIAGKYPTGALAVVEFPAAKWGDVSPGSGEIVELILPRELD
ncbi:MAG: histidine phosphatase family protein [Sphingomonas sp.]|nr:histidine phosphatase family protein [Sphingomonas sp.]